MVSDIPVEIGINDEDESNDKTEYIKGLNYTSVIPFLTEAIKEQQEMIKEQQEIIKKLEDRITQLENN